MLEVSTLASNIVTVAGGLYVVFRFGRRLIRARAAVARRSDDSGDANG